MVSRHQSNQRTPSGLAVKILKLICGFICLAIVAANIWTMSRWSERRGVADDLCYLRQAHLFQQHGLHGVDTDIKTETDGYFRRLVTEIGQPGWHDDSQSVCHIDMSGTSKRVLQYPPGTGALLALFPEGHQVMPLYTAANVVVLLMALAAIGLAQSCAMTLAAAGFGWVALYLMINPAKASYSIAPTVAICAVVGYLTAKTVAVPHRHRWLHAAAIGILLGLSVNFRIPNALLCVGYGVFLLAIFSVRRDRASFGDGAVFGLGVVAGMLPTLLYNAINAGSPFTTTYGGQDVGPPDFTFSITRAYLGDVQGALIIAAIAAVVALLMLRRTRPLWPIAAIVALNLAVDLGYFLSHPIFTQYYLIPLAMLSLWSLLFGCVLHDRRTA
jgi:hypothetical protein